MKWFLNSMIVICLAVPILVFGGGVYMAKGLPWEAIAAKKSITAALETRYDEKFTLGSMSFDLFHGGGYYTTATSVANGTQFYAGMTDGVLDEGYGYEYWSGIVNERALAIAKKEYPSVAAVQLSLMQGGKGTLHEQYESMTWTAYLNVAETISEANEEQALQQSYRLFEQLSLQVKLASFFLGFDNKAIQIREGELDAVQSYEAFSQFLKTYDETY